MAKTAAKDNALQAALLRTLSDLGGRNATEDDIISEGTRLVIPAGITKIDAVKILARSIEAEEETMAFTRKFQYRCWDGANAFNSVVERFFGMMHQVPTQTMFGPEPPERVTINIGFNKTKQVPWGQLELPMMPGMTINLGATHDAEMGTLFCITASGPGKYRHAIEGVFVLVDKELAENSMYRGQAIDGRDEAQFLDLSGVDARRVIYSDSVMTQLGANVWSLLDYTREQELYGLPLKRAVLLEGPYGTGKTLAAYLTAQHAVRNDWTFVYCRPAQDNIESVMQTARLYQPAVVFFEDLDTLATDEGEHVSRLLDLFDGINAKGTRIMAILTTNHKELIHKGMLRPGRLDAVIHIGALDAGGVERMIRAEVDVTTLSADVDYAAVYAAMEGYMPAFVKEAIDRAKRYNIARNMGRLTTLDTEDFISSASGLRMQLELMEGNPEHKGRTDLAVVMDRTVHTAAQRAVAASIDEKFLSDSAREVLAETSRNGH